MTLLQYHFNLDTHTSMVLQELLYMSNSYGDFSNRRLQMFLCLYWFIQIRMLYMRMKKETAVGKSFEIKSICI